MGWEVYTRQIIRTGEPTVTITKMGRVAINMLATSLFEGEKATHVVLLWDRDVYKCAIRLATSKDAGAYTLTYNDKSNGSGFSAVTFLNYIQYDWRETRAFTAEWDASSKMLIFSVPSQYIGNTVPDGYKGRGSGLKRADRISKASLAAEESEVKNQEATEVTS